MPLGAGGVLVARLRRRRRRSERVGADGVVDDRRQGAGHHLLAVDGAELDAAGRAPRRALGPVADEPAPSHFPVIFRSFPSFSLGR